MEQKDMYLVSCIGYYSEKSQDFSQFLYDSFDKARECFEKLVRKAHEYYAEDLVCDDIDEYPDCCNSYALYCEEGNVQIQIMKVRLNHKATVIPS